MNLILILAGVALAPAAVASGWWPLLALALWAAVIYPVAKRRRDQHKNRKDIHQ